ncbi:MAG: hypothetical protein JRJ84_14650 [Deltaproteobacteria bacterium]|nr:hypothetical protein [Deltaproteobacteria bacterium]
MHKMVLIPILLVSAPALATTVATDFQPPDEVPMFESARLIPAKGKAKGSCEEALALAMTDLEAKATKKKHPQIISLYEDKPEDSWASAAELPCEIKGDPSNPKGATVKLEALAVRTGEGDAFAPVAGTRITEIVAALTPGGMGITGRVAALSFEDFKGALYYTVRMSREDTFASSVNRNTRAVTVYREVMTPNLGGYVEKLQGVTEAAGLHLRVTCKRVHEGEEKYESFHLYAPTDLAAQFVAGDISEQELSDGSAVMYESGGTTVKMDISFVDAGD